MYKGPFQHTASVRAKESLDVRDSCQWGQPQVLAWQLAAGGVGGVTKVQQKSRCPPWSTWKDEEGAVPGEAQGGQVTGPAPGHHRGDGPGKRRRLRHLQAALCSCEREPDPPVRTAEQRCLTPAWCPS